MLDVSAANALLSPGTDGSGKATAGEPSDLPRDDEERAMHRNRLLPMTQPQPTREPTPSPAAFVLFPVACLPAVPDAERLQQQALYEWAFQQAREVLKPSILERDLLGVWN